MESNREWDDIETEVYSQPLEHPLTAKLSEAEVLHQVVPLTTGRTFRMTLHSQRGAGNGRASNDGFGSSQRI